MTLSCAAKLTRRFTAWRRASRSSASAPRLFSFRSSGDPLPQQSPIRIAFPKAEPHSACNYTTIRSAQGKARYRTYSDSNDCATHYCIDDAEPARPPLPEAPVASDPLVLSGPVRKGPPGWRGMNGGPRGHADTMVGDPL